MAHTYLELSNGASHKFYEVTVDGDSFTVRFGRIGTHGTTKTMRCSSREVAQAEAEHKIATKRQKGYVEVEVPGERRPMGPRDPVRAQEIRERREATVHQATLRDGETRMLEFSSERSSKFWKISVSGASYTVHYGRKGQAGQRLQKDFKTVDEARVAANKKLVDKMAKGYRLVKRKE